MFTKEWLFNGFGYDQIPQNNSVLVPSFTDQDTMYICLWKFWLVNSNSTVWLIHLDKLSVMIYFTEHPSLDKQFYHNSPFYLCMLSVLLFAHLTWHNAHS